MQPDEGQSSTTQTLISAEGLVKHYGATRAVREISFSVQRGQVVGFLGPNGAGKSTTMKMLTGFLRPTSGTARIGGFDVAQEPMAARALLGYLPENAPLYDDMMVIDFLHFVAGLRGLDVAAQHRQLKVVIERCGLGDVLGKDIAQLSKGYRQRVGLAQALVHDPDLLILDEPTSGLDPNQIVEIRALIRDLGRDKTVLLSTHILSEVQAVCSRAIIISNGSLVADDTPERLGRGDGHSEVYITLRGKQGASLQSPEVVQTLGRTFGANCVKVLGQGPDGLALAVSSKQDGDIREQLFGCIVANHWLLVEMRPKARTLEETFLQLTRSAAKTQGARHAA